MPGHVLNRTYEIVAIASSAGGIGALETVISGLPADFAAPIVILQHLDPNHRSLLKDILARFTQLPVKQAATGDHLKPGNIYIAPPNRHCLIRRGLKVELVDTEPVHYVRPSADLLFESIASSCGERAIAVILTGTGADGSDGIRAIKDCGGTVIAQDRATSQFFGMPGAAIATGRVDFVLALGDICGALVKLVNGIGD